jgi:hypothetical protein
MLYYVEPPINQSHFDRAAGGLILRLSYGYVVDPHGNDYLVDLAERAIREFALAFTPGMWMVDSIPACKYLMQPNRAIELTTSFLQ